MTTITATIDDIMRSNDTHTYTSPSVCITIPLSVHSIPSHLVVIAKVVGMFLHVCLLNGKKTSDWFFAIVVELSPETIYDDIDTDRRQQSISQWPRETHT